MAKKYEIEIRGLQGFDNTKKGKKYTGHQGFFVQWSAAGIGWGELAMYHDEKTGKLCVDSECMSDAFIDAVLLALAKACIRVG